ncbi:pleckstrin homology domain-containing family M member 1 isoform X2 [Trichomycterus rosablanca]|uniref:pleckstrin homology domain-containing family M member 1 isoform X2 n=1 Tax=Trichomycterus rosablanca TaxID=2290929 RepID=UPI002F35056F
MLATQPADSFPEANNARQWIKEKLAQTLKTLQKRYVATDAAVTSEDSEANQLCSALEAVFIHGLRSKHVRSDAGGARSRRGASLPQPVFWNLLKTVTHRDVILELEGLSFVSSDVGRCRAWVRLALNDGLLECYLTSLLRENTELGVYYQPGALLLDPEEREVLLSLLQGLASLAFRLSYKSAVLNEWTATPLALAGLCPAPPADDLRLTPAAPRRESWDTESQSSESVSSGRGAEGVATASDFSLDTPGSSQLSSSLGSEKGSWSGRTENRSPLDQISCSSSQDLDLLSPAPDAVMDSHTDPPGTSSSEEEPSREEPPEPELAVPDAPVEDEQLPEDPPVITCRTVTPPVTSQITVTSAPVTPPDSGTGPAEGSAHAPVGRTSSALSRTLSSGSVSSYHFTAWISEEDFYKPESRGGDGGPEEPETFDSSRTNGTASPVPESQSHQSPPSVIHRRQIGLSNPFRGLLKLGQLERRGALGLGLWRAWHCELSPFELRLYADGEERSSCENRSLLRCENVCLDADARFYLEFQGKKLHLRAASRAEAEDWVESVGEAVSKVRRQHQEEWGDLTPFTPPVVIPSEPVDVAETDWSRPCEAEPDAIKEALVFLSREERGWSRAVLSLSLEALRGFSVQDGRKSCLFSYSIEAVRDVVPDVALGGPSFFKVITAKGALTVRAESGEEARCWRSLIRGALDLYLDEESGTGEVTCPGGGNVLRLVHHRLKGDGALLPHLTVVPTERGLDAQNFKCAGCPRQIGVSLGRARLCEFSAQYYCDTCHHGDTVVIPSRMVHNWDLAAREVSRPALKLLTDVKQEPLLNLELLNPDLFHHTETMATVQRFRQQLRLLGDYVRICRSGIRKTIEDRLEQRTYLLESGHLYSVLDLMQIADGQYVSVLQSLIQFSSNHVHQCDLCTQRGFICQICNTDEIVFPFQFDATTRCLVCKTVFHSSCKARTVSCPRCERLQRYKERNLLH